MNNGSLTKEEKKKGEVFTYFVIKMLFLGVEENEGKKKIDFIEEKLNFKPHCNLGGKEGKGGEGRKI